MPRSATLTIAHSPHAMAMQEFISIFLSAKAKI